MSMPAGHVFELDVRIKFITGEVLGLKEKEQVVFTSTTSKEAI